MLDKKRMSLFLAAFLFSVSVYSLVRAADYQPAAEKSGIGTVASDRFGSEERATQKVSETDAFTPRVFRMWNGSVAIFRPGNAEPETVLSTDCDSLPEDAAEKLKEGIFVYSLEQYYSCLEDFS